MVIRGGGAWGGEAIFEGRGWDCQWELKGSRAGVLLAAQQKQRMHLVEGGCSHTLRSTSCSWRRLVPLDQASHRQPSHNPQRPLELTWALPPLCPRYLPRVRPKQAPGKQTAEPALPEAVTRIRITGALPVPRVGSKGSMG